MLKILKKLKNGRCATSKMLICLNVLLHYKKYQKLVGEPVIVIKNDGLEKYDKFVGKTGIVTDFEFVNLKRPISVHFPTFINSEDLCFGLDEIRKVK